MECLIFEIAINNIVLGKVTNGGCCIGRDGTRFDIKCAFIYSDIMVNISQLSPVAIQNKNHLEIIQMIYK